MRYIIFAVGALSFTLAHAEKELQLDSAKFENKSTTVSILQKADELRRNAIQKLGLEKKQDAVRHIKKGGTPEIIIKKSTIFFNGKAINLGESLSRWKRILGGKPFCVVSKMTLCTWQNLGIQAGTADATPDSVNFMNLYLNIPDHNSTSNSDIRGAEDWRVKSPFLGYLELDGYGIDKATKFSEILSRADKDRNLRCGLRECGFPHGAFGNEASLHFELNGGSESSLVNQISVTR